MLWNIRKIVKKGDYLYAVVPEHPKAIRFGYVLAHRIVMENHLNRLLEDNEEVHHKDRNKHNNDPENLEVLSKEEHIKLHIKEREFGGLGHFIDLVCANCGKDFKREYHDRNPQNKNQFCSRSCNGKFNGYQHKDK